MISSPYNFKGDVASISALPASGEVNDTYYVQDVKYKVTWTGSAWVQSSLSEADYQTELTYMDNKISELKSELNPLSQFGKTVEATNIIPIDVEANINGFSKKAGFYVSIGNDDDHLYLTPNSGYKVYYIINSFPVKFYLDNPTLEFLDVGVIENVTMTDWEATGSGFVIRGTDAVRYRKSENNLPTSENPINLSANSMIVISVTSTASTNLIKAYMSAPFLKRVYFSDLAKTIGQNEYIPMSQKAISDLLKNEDYVTVVVNSETSKTIRFGKFSADFNYYDYNGLRQHAWNFATGIYNGDNVIVPTGTDIIGVLKETGESDFMGGVHGDETNVYTKMFMDGVEVTESVSGKNLDIIMYSHLTRVSTGEQVADRFVHIKISNNTITIENTFKCLVDCLSIDYAYNGGLIAWYLEDCNGIWINDRYYDIENPSSIPLSSTIRSFVASLENNSIVSVENILGYGDPNYGGGLTFFSNETPQRLKVYIANDKNTVWNNGHVCNGKFKYVFS